MARKIFFLILVKRCCLFLLAMDMRPELRANPDSADVVAWKHYVDVLHDPSSTPSLRAHAVIDLLRKTDGQQAPTPYQNKVETWVGPPLPYGYDQDQLHDFLQSPKLILSHSTEAKLSSWLLNWGSGGRLRTPRLMNSTLTRWFEGLFSEIERTAPDIQINLIDLFHGHIIWDEAARDILIIFHSKEYPEDLDPFKVGRALEMQPDLLPFRSDTDSFLRRNIIWSLRMNKFWRINTSSATSFSDLVKLQEYAGDHDLETKANTLNESALGLPICDINLLRTGQISPEVLFLY